MSFRKTGLALAAAVCLVATAATAQLMGIFGDYRLVVAYMYSLIAPTSSTQMSPDNGLIGAAVNSAFEVNGGSAHGAFYVPATSNNSWLYYHEFSVDDTSAFTSAQMEVLASGNRTGWGASINNCISGGGDRCIYVNGPGATQPTAINVTARMSSALFQWWQSQGALSITGAAGSGWNQGNFPWTATGGSCSREPSGILAIPAAGTISSSGGWFITDPGAGCLTAPSAPAPSSIGAGSGTGGTATIAIGTTTGVRVAPGQRACGMVGQYGADAASGVQGDQFAIYSDTGGNALPGSPNLVTISNLAKATSIAGTVNATNQITVTSISGSVTGLNGIYPGQQISGTGLTSVNIVSQASGTPGGAGVYVGTAVQAATGGSVTAGTGSFSGATAANQFYYSGTTLNSAATIGDIFDVIGSGSITTGSNQKGWGGGVGPFGMIWGVMPGSGGATSQQLLGMICARTGPTVTGSISGSTLTTSTTPAVSLVGMTISAPGVSGSPYVVSGSGTSWTLSASPGNVASATILTSIDPQTWFTANGMTVNAYYPMKDPGTWTDATGHYSPLAVLGPAYLATGGPIGGGPSTPPSQALTLIDAGAGQMWALRNAAGGLAPPLTGYGSVGVNGFYNPSAFTGAAPVIQAQISATPGGAALSGCSPSCAWQTVATGSGGGFSGKVPGVPAGGPYYLSVRSTLNSSYVVTGSPLYVGMNLAFLGQSQEAFLFVASNTGNALAVTWTGGFIVNPLDINTESVYAYNPSFSSNGVPVLSHVGIKPLTPLSVPGGSVNVAGDGIVALENALHGLSGYPVSVTNLTRSGNPIDSWADGYVTVGTGAANCGVVNPTSGSGPGPYVFTMAFNTGCLGVGAGINSVEPANTVLAGSVSFYVSGALAAQDGQTTTYGVSTSSVCNNVGYTVASCAIDYIAGTASITFTTTPAAAPTIQWTNIVDIQIGTATTKIPSAQYDGQDFFGNGPATSGVISATMARVVSPFNAVIDEQCDSNLTEFGSGSASAYAAGAVSVGAKHSYVIGTKLPATFSQFDPATPVFPLGFPRDETWPISTGLIGNLNGCNQWLMDFGTSGGSYAYSGTGPVGFGGTYQDISVLTAGLTADNPHPTTGNFSGARKGRRIGAEIYSFLLSNATAKEPTVSTVAFDYSSTYNSVTGWTCNSSAPGNCIDVTFALNASGATSLATCGIGLSGGTHPPTGTCADNGVGQIVEGFRIGTAQYPWTTGSTFDDGWDPAANAFVAPSAGQTTGIGFVCKQVAATVIQCHKNTGTWASGATYASYLDPWATTRAGTLRARGTVMSYDSTGVKNIAGGLSYSVTGGSGCTGSGVISVSQSGETTSGFKASINFVVSGGAILAAYPSAPGYGITVLGTTVYPTGCSGTISLPSTAMGTWSGDDDLLGQYLYDNSGAASPLSGVLGGNEPGMPVRAFGIGGYNGAVAVSG